MHSHLPSSMNRTSLILGFLVSISLIAIASRPSMSPSRSDLVGVWVGFDTSYPDFYRVNLRENNTGTLVVLFPEGQPDVYALRWEFSERQLLLQASPLTTNCEVIACSVAKVDSRRMEFAINGISNAWKRTALLLNEKKLSARIAESAKHEPKAVQKGKELDFNNRQ